MTHKLIRRFLVSLTFALAFSTSGAVLAGEFEGGWVLNDSNGKPFDVSLNADGTASGTHNDSMKEGTWIEVDDAAIIHWNTGWVTRITRQGDKYFKQAFKPGTSLSDNPANTSDAQKTR